MIAQSLALGLIASLLSPASAYIRFTCGNALIEERADPIVSPGGVSGHVHKIAGGGNFGFNMDYDQARASKCSSCPIVQDLSNYWTPKLYFHNQNGTFSSVPTMGDDARELNGGMTVYYQQRGPSKATLKAFPPGFRMLAGDAFQRNFTGTFAAQAVTFACLGANQPETNNLPNYNCPSGLRAQIYFPSCWDGVNLDSADHKSHMAYPASGNYNSGPCPASHPVQLISLFFEVLYDTNRFKDQWYGNSQPFVFASGDATGYGFHGDFVNGWDVDTLQAVITTCTDDSKFGSTAKDACPPLDQFTSSQMNSCRLPSSLGEQVIGTIPLLPGCNPVTNGPERAIPGANCPAGSAVGALAPTIGPAESYFTDVTQSKGYAYMGCGTDSTATRSLTGASTVYMSGVGAKMTVEYCVDFCKGKGFSIAGIEYGTQCFCGNTIAADRAPQEGILGACSMACAGDAGEYCGGPSALSLYQKCTSSSNCQNNGFKLAGNSTSAAGSAGSVVAAPAVAAAAAASSSWTSGWTTSTSTTKGSAATSSSVKGSSPTTTTKSTSTTTKTTSSSSTKTSTTSLAPVVKAVSVSSSSASTSTPHALVYNDKVLNYGASS